MKKLGARQTLLGLGVVASFCAVFGMKTALAADLDINTIKAKIPAEIKVATDTFTDEEKISILKKIAGNEADGKLSYDAASSPENIVISLTADPSKKFEVKKAAFKKGADLEAVAAHYVDSSLFQDNEKYQNYLKSYIRELTKTTGEVNMAPITREYSSFVVIYKLGTFGVPGKEPINQILTNLPISTHLAGSGEPVLPHSGQIMSVGPVDGKTTLNFLSQGAYPNLYAFVNFYVGNGAQADIDKFDPSVKQITVKSLTPGENIESKVKITQYTGINEHIAYDIPDASLYNQYYLHAEVVKKADSLALRANLAKKAENILASYDFKIKSRLPGTPINLTDDVTVSIPVNQDTINLINQNRVKLYHLKDQNTHNELPFELKNGAVTFKTKDFSEFTLVSTPTTTPTEENLGAPNTGFGKEQTSQILLLSLAVLAGIGLTGFALRKSLRR